MSAGPELSSVSSALDDLTKRIGTAAESFSGTTREDLATTLFEVERALQAARRRLDTVVNDLL